MFNWFQYISEDILNIEDILNLTSIVKLYVQYTHKHIFIFILLAQFSKFAL